MSIDIESLNEPQREAVLATEGPLLVLAGAGSGKTRVLTYRIAHLLQDCHVAPWEILAITFTNKAAAEMRQRLGNLVGPTARGMWVATFHSMCVRILRADCDRIGYAKGFTIYDDDDQKRLFKEILIDLDIDPKRFPLPTIRNRISTAKNELISPKDFAETANDPIGKVAARVYTRLQERLKALNAFDFDDLLFQTYILLEQNADVLDAYQNRFRYLMVDEYQDTNHAQYSITTLLAAKSRNIMVVGDDDQSIYSWRGADIRNILEFENDYPEARVVKLEQNYRSTGNILAAANAVISNNRNRKAKKLFTSGVEGEKVAVYLASDERDEGRWIAAQIEKRHGEGIPYDEIALFYRTNAQSRVLEDMMLRAGIPYRIVGGTRFFDRAEIRDIMAYLTLTVNPRDDVAAKRVVNVPRRGIGKSTIDRIEAVAREENVTFLEAAYFALADDAIRPATRKALSEFLQIIDEATHYEGALRPIVEMITEKSGLITALENENTDEARSRVENLKEFLGVVDEYVVTHDEEEAEYAPPSIESVHAGQGALEQASEADKDAENGDKAVPPRVLSGDSLADFVEWVRLRTDLDTLAEDGKAITLMTVHAAKGLEFDSVFVAGMEESLFPHMSSDDPLGMEEERRLAYVAITRARKHICLTCAATRQIFGQASPNPASRFINEIPVELRMNSGVGSAGFSGSGWEKRGSRRGIAGSGREAGEGRVFGRSGSSDAAGGFRANPEAGKKSAAHMAFAVGDDVDHKTFGRGIVTKVDGDTLHIHFKNTGATKKLLKDYAPIVKLG